MTNIVIDESRENLSDSSQEKYIKLGEQSHNNLKVSEKYIKLGEQSHNNLKVYQIGEPILLNPNSYNNLADILDKLKKNLDIGTIRE